MNKLTDNIIKYYIETLMSECEVTEDEAYEMFNYALQNNEIEEQILNFIDNNTNEIFA